MKKLILFIALAMLVYNSYGQTTNTTEKNLYGPVPYRTPEQTIGEDYTPPL